MKSDIIFNKDFTLNTVYVMKVFQADAPKVWDYFTKSELLDQWWAPKPWKCETVEMTFKEGGVWHYAMAGPDGERMYAQVKYGEITEHRSFDGVSAFCDAKGIINEDLSPPKWLFGFTGVEGGTKVTVNIHFASSEVMKHLMEMGFEGGFTMGLNQLDELLGK